VDGTGSGLCPVVSFGITSVECTTRRLVKNLQTPYASILITHATVIHVRKMYKYLNWHSIICLFQNELLR
jgi:hypothetical protein